MTLNDFFKRYNYPPDEQITAVETVLKQSETLGKELIAG